EDHAEGRVRARGRRRSARRAPPRDGDRREDGRGRGRHDPRRKHRCARSLHARPAIVLRMAYFIGHDLGTSGAKAVLVDEHGGRDSRGDAQASRMVRRLGGERSVAAFAGASPTGKDLVAKMAWIRDEEPAVFARTRAFCDATGYLVLRATGEIVCDPTAAGGF